VTAVALIPARAGSTRVPGKNVMLLAGHPLIAYSIAAATASGVFDSVVVSTDGAEIAEIARRYGADVPGLRRPEIATATSPDIDWVLDAMSGRDDSAFAILRPTSPFRTAETIRRAWRRFSEAGDHADSIRAVELVRQHPGKMWLLRDSLMEPLLDRRENGTPWHSMQYQALPKVYVQNSSLEIAWRHVLDEQHPTISGDRVLPFLTEQIEGFTIDYPDDVLEAERLVADGSAALPPVG
jgi:CMP-N,N'-diacetyllegionaminic acid synthase